MNIYREEVVNVELARILVQYGLPAEPEIITHRKMPDVMIVFNGLKINLEGRFVNNALSQTLEKDCIRRLEDNIADITLGIYYPEDIKRAGSLEQLSQKLKESYFDISIFYLSEQGLKKYEFKKIKLKNLVEGINNVYNIVRDSDLLKNTISEVEKTINHCSDVASKNNLFFNSEKLILELRKTLGIAHDQKLEEKEKNQLLEIAFFIIFDALVFHETLSTTIPKIETLKKTIKTKSQVSIIREWGKILKIDFIPIFLIAKKILLSLPTSITTEEILEQLSNQAVNVLSSGIVLKHDLMGRVYHKLLLKSTGEFYATYYTSIPAAWILANLSIKTGDEFNCQSLKTIEGMSLIDPACGSGTLLSALYCAIKDKYILFSKEKQNLDELHRILIEKVIHGWDVLDYAGHLTLTSLALHNYKVFFDKPNIYILPAGQINNELHLGSLDYLEPQGRLLGKGFYEIPKRKDINNDFVEDSGVKTKGFDLVIMNPPFSRSAGLINTKFGYTEKEVQLKLNKHLAELGNKLNLAGIGQAGLGAYFIALGDRILRKNGKIAVVIPRAILSGVSWQKIRDILLNGYEIEYIVSNHDPGSKEKNIDPWSFSENTKLSEVLVVAKKTDKEMKDKYSTIVNIWNKPKNEIESLIISSNSRKIREKGNNLLNQNAEIPELKYSDKVIGCVYNIPQNYLKYNFLFTNLFANPFLNKFTFKLLFGDIIKTIPLESISDSLGIDRKQISLTFKTSQVKTPTSILWGHPISINSLNIKEDNLTNVEPVNNNYENLLKSSANLLVVEHLFLNNNKVVSVFSPKPILSTAFWEVKTDEKLSKILNLWFNSTYGFILLLSNAISSYGSQINIKKDQLKQIKVIDPKQLNVDDMQDWIDFYEELDELKFEKFQEEFSKAFQGTGLRKKIDDFINKELNLKMDLKPYYKMLSEEPIISQERL